MPDVTRHRSRFRIVTLVAVALMVLVGATTGCTPRELGGRSQGLANHERARRGLGELAWDQNAADKAQAWAEKLAASRTLQHSRLTEGITGNWKVLGENVGFARSVDDTHIGFMNSPKHRDAILNGEFTAVGVGVAEARGVVYVVQVFRG